MLQLFINYDVPDKPIVSTFLQALECYRIFEVLTSCLKNCFLGANKTSITHYFWDHEVSFQ